MFQSLGYNKESKYLDLQAAARAHRLGQTRPVKIIKVRNRAYMFEILLRSCRYRPFIVGDEALS